MRRKNLMLLIIIITLFYLVCQNGVKGNSLRHGNDKEENVNMDGNERYHNVDKRDLEIPDEATTLFKRVQEMPLKLGLQFLSAKYGISGSLDKARRGGTSLYDGTKDAIETMTDFIGEGIGNARYLLFGTK